MSSIHLMIRIWITRNAQLCPDYEGTELGIGESLLIKAIAESTGRSLALIKADLKKEGDLGLVAMVRQPYCLIYCVSWHAELVIVDLI